MFTDTDIQRILEENCFQIYERAKSVQGKVDLGDYEKKLIFYKNIFGIDDNIRGWSDDFMMKKFEVPLFFEIHFGPSGRPFSESTIKLYDEKDTIITN